MSKELINAIESIAGEISEHSGNVDRFFDVEIYSSIASIANIYKELERSANALERIATALEKK